MPYIADTYVNNRQMDVKAAEKNGEFATMTARQLLSILRLAQAHAKLYFREEVKMEDVDEALRLVYMSKASVLDTEEVKNKREDVLSAIFAVVRDYFVANAADAVMVEELEKHVNHRGYTAMQFQVDEGGRSER